MTVTTQQEGIRQIPQSRLLRTEIPGPRSTELQRRRHRTVADGVASTLPVYVTEASGGVLVDADGNRLIDLGSGIAVTNVGNSAPAVVEAVREQLEAFTHTCFMVTPYESYLRVCEELAELTPGEHDKRSALFNSGAEAVENAVKIARHATGRPAVVAFDHGYHGRTNLTLALTAKAKPYKHGFGPFAPDVHRVPMSYPARDEQGRTGEQAAREALADIERQLGADSVAAVVIEPIQGEGGFVEPAPGFLGELARWCRHNGALLVADEVQTGFCRTGRWFACEHEDVVPDLVTTAKGMAGGLPLSAVTGRAEVMNAAHAGGLGGTYGGNPAACAAALATIATMRDNALDAAAREIENLVKPRLRALAERTGVVFDVRGRGAMLAVELCEPESGEPAPELTKRVARTCHEQGVIVLTCGSYGNVIRLLPPLVIGHDLLAEGVAILERAIEQHAG